MTLPVTIALLIASLAIAAFSNYKTRQPYEPGRLPWIPYTALQFVAILVFVLMLAHLISLLTGTPLVGRLIR